MNNALAMKPTEYAPLICPPIFKRKRSEMYEQDALQTLRDYRRFSEITKEEYDEYSKQIKAAPHNDAIANVMTKVRRQIYK